MDGKGARRSRLRRRFVRYATFLIVALVAALLVTRLPTVDPEYLISGDGRPFVIGALMALLGSTILIGLAWMRRTPNH